MIQTRSHIIKRQVLEVSLTDKKDATDIQNRLSVVYRQNVIPLLDRIFSRLSPGDDLIKIEQLDIDIGTLHQRSLEEDFYYNVKNRLEEEFTKIVYKVREGVVQQNVQMIPAQNLIASGKQGLQSGVLQTLLSYFETGHFSWRSETKATDFSSLKETFLSFSWPEWFEKEIKSLSRFENIRLRIFDFTPIEKHKKLISQLYPNQVSLINDLVVDLKKLSEVMGLDWGANDPNDLTLINLILRRIAMDAAGEARVNNDSFIIPILTELITESSENRLKNPFSGQLESISWKVLDEKRLSKILKPIIKASIAEQNVINEDQETAKKTAKKPSHETSKTRSQFNKKKDQLVFPQRKNTKQVNPSIRNKEIEYSETDSFYVLNAGLILVWPYLQIFFRELGLLDDDLQFENEKKAWKAIHLLQYLCTGEEEQEEFEFLLHKILCGLKPDDFVPTQSDLTELEKEECINLLEVLIKNWPVLKNTSVQGLQKTFIQRQGVLSKGHDGWELKIERKGYDIVLDRLTWPIALIKLPWNDYLIHVKW